MLGLVVALLVGISLGRALEDGPSPGGTQTNVRTLEPQPLPPAARTVTVTVTTRLSDGSGFQLAAGLGSFLRRDGF